MWRLGIFLHALFTNRNTTRSFRNLIFVTSSPYHCIDSLCLTFAATWVVDKVILQASAVAQLMPASVVVCCSICSAHRILIGRTLVKALAASVMCTVRLANSKPWTLNVKAGIEICVIQCNIINIFNFLPQCLVKQTQSPTMVQGMGVSRGLMEPSPTGFRYVRIFRKDFTLSGKPVMCSQRWVPALLGPC